MGWIRGLAAAAAASFLLNAAPASAGPSHASCSGFIDALPDAEIAAGTYCLRNDIDVAIVSGPALQLVGPGITLDCNGFTIRNTAGARGGMAIEAGGDDVVVRNCGVQGFGQGIYAKGQRTLVENNRLANLGAYAISSEGNDSRVIGNHIRDVGLDDVGGATAIQVYGVGEVSHNTIDGVRPQALEDGFATVTGIFLSQADGPVTGNRIRGLDAPGTYGYVYGIDSWTNGTTVQITRNHIDGPELRESWAIRCEGFGGAGENVVTGFYRWLDDTQGFGIALVKGCHGLGPQNVGVR